MRMSVGGTIYNGEERLVKDARVTSYSGLGGRISNLS
jgi:hypothetical protein